MAKTIKVKNINGKDLKSSKSNKFSGWYLPNDNLVIKFGYSGHIMFFAEYFPYRSDLSVKDINDFNPAQFELSELKKYYKPIKEKIAKSTKDFFSNYDTFYELGWVRFNYEDKKLKVTYKDVKEKDLNNFYIWAIDNLKINEALVGIKVDNYEETESYTYDEFKDKVFTKSISKQDTISAVRNRLFGPGNYIYDDINSFDELFNLIMENLKCQKK
jgi:hypothetical protein